MPKEPSSHRQLTTACRFDPVGERPAAAATAASSDEVAAAIVRGARGSHDGYFSIKNAAIDARFKLDFPGEALELQTIRVSKESQNKGVASAYLKAGIEAARQLGLQRFVVSQVLPANAEFGTTGFLAPMLERRGFEVDLARSSRYDTTKTYYIDVAPPEQAPPFETRRGRGRGRGGRGAGVARGRGRGKAKKSSKGRGSKKSSARKAR